MTVKTIKLNGEYTTAAEYAKENNINNRTLRLKLKNDEHPKLTGFKFPHEVVQVAGTYLIKIK